MQTNIIILIVGLQLAIILITLLVIRLVSGRRSRLTRPAAPADYLADEISRTRLVLDGPLAKESEAMHAILGARLNYLEAERSAHTASLEDPEHFWNRLAETLELPLAEPSAAATTADTATAVVTEEASPPEPTSTGNNQEENEKQMLRELVTTYEGRINSLEVFRDQFFELKDQLDKVKTSHEELQEELERVLPKSERTEQLEKLNTVLKEEKASLEARLARMAEGADKLGPPKQSTRRGTATERTAAVEKEVEAIAAHMADQEDILHALKEEAGDSSLDQEELLELVKKIDGLQDKLQSIRTKSRNLELENRKLHNELQNTLGEVKSKDLAIDDYRETVDDLKQLVVQQKERIRELNLDLGQKAEQGKEIETMKEMINDFTAKNAEMMMCVYTLEDENNFLQDQIAELLKLDRDASNDDIKQATDAAVDSAKLHQEIDDLKQELSKKVEDYSELQKKFASMEKEYLDMYAEMRSKGG